MRCCLTENFIELKQPMGIFPLLKRICNHQFTVLTNVLNRSLSTVLPWKEWSYPAIDSDIPWKINAREEQSHILTEWSNANKVQ